MHAGAGSASAARNARGVVWADAAGARLPHRLSRLPVRSPCLIHPLCIEATGAGPSASHGKVTASVTRGGLASCITPLWQTPGCAHHWLELRRHMSCAQVSLLLFACAALERLGDGTAAEAMLIHEAERRPSAGRRQRSRTTRGFGSSPVEPEPVSQRGPQCCAHVQSAACPEGFRPERIDRPGRGAPSAARHAR